MGLHDSTCPRGSASFAIHKNNLPLIDHVFWMAKLAEPREYRVYWRSQVDIRLLRQGFGSGGKNFVRMDYLIQTIDVRLQRYEIAMVLAVAGLYFFSFIQRVGIPGSIFNDLQSEMNLDAATVTRLGAIYLFIYAIAQPFVGVLADRFGGARVAMASGLLLVMGAALFPLSHSVVGLNFSRALVGLGGSAMFLCMFKEADHSFSGKHFTVVLGILSLIGYCGGLAGT